MAARRFGDARAALTLWSMGVNQSHAGTDKNAAILNLHLATRQIGRPGAGPFSLTGQPNAMGGRETGGLAHLLPGYRKVADPIARRTVEARWGVPPGTIPTRPGRSALEIFEGLASGEVRAVWIVCTNPAASMPDLDTVERALRQADLVIVQDAYHPTETTRFADILLPAAQWPEKDGVMTSSERRLTYLPQAGGAARRGPAGRRDLRGFAREMGWKAAFPYESTAEIFDEFAALTAGTPCDYAGVSHARLRAEGPLQWPVPTACHPGTGRLYAMAAFPRPTAARPSWPWSTPSRWSRSTRDSHSSSPPVGSAITGTRSPAPARRQRWCAARRSPCWRCTLATPPRSACRTATSSRSPRAAARRSPSAG